MIKIMNEKILYKKIIKYCDDIINNKINACQKHRWACKRFLKDLCNDIYFFDINEVYKFYVWSSMFNHFEGALSGKPILLTDFQLFIAANIFGFVNISTHSRRFKKAYVQLGRKNAKSQLLALIASYTAFTSQQEKKLVLIAGWDKAQSKHVYDAIVLQLKNCEMLKGKYINAYGKCTHKKTQSVILPLSREAKNTGDGYNPTLGIIDEYHAHKTSEIYDVIYSGMVARKESLMFVITTAGTNLNCPCYAEYKHVSKIINPNIDIHNEEYFVLICELEENDDIKNSETWIKANPIVATYDVGMKGLESAVKTAIDKPEDYRNVITKNFNCWVQMRESGYMDMQKWAACGNDNSKLSNFTGCCCYIGIDLSSTLDLTAVAFEFVKDGKFYVFAQGFITNNEYKRRLLESRLPFDLWVKDKWLTVVDDVAIDYDIVEKYIIDTVEEYDLKVKEIDYDGWNATQFALRLNKKGFECVEIRQGYHTLSEPTKNFRECSYKGTVVHNNNPVLSWCVSNAITVQDSAGNIKIDKSKSGEKIDLLIAVVIAHVRAYIDFDAVDYTEIMNDYLNTMGW